MRKRTGKQLTAAALALTLLCAVLPAASGAGVDTHNSRIAGSTTHSLAIGKDGRLYLWGSNQYLQLARDGATVEVQKPTAADIDATFVSVAAGGDFSAALDYAGSVYVWGYNQSAAPQKADISQVAAITAGQTDILALKSDGTVWQWGISQEPAQVAGLTDIAAIAGGNGHYLALSFTGDVYAWGSNYYGQLGDGTTTDRAQPVRVLGLVDIVDIAAGTSHSLAVSYSGHVYAWGNNAYGEMGTKTVNFCTVPLEVSKLEKVVQVAAGNESSMALTKDGEVYTWGYGEYGQLGTGSSATSSPTPTKVNGIPQKVVEIAAGVYHDMALTENNALYAWGRNRNYQLGNGKDSNANTPQKISLSVSPQLYTYNIAHFNTVSDWARSETQTLYDAELVPPMLWGSYQENITRAEFAHMLVGVYEQVKGATVSSTSSKLDAFTDIEDHLLSTDLRKAFNLGIMNGTGDNTFSPDRTITRQEAAKMLCSFVAKLEGEKIPTTAQNLSIYADAAQIAEWAVPYVYYAYQNNIMRGTGDGFTPLGLLSREQALVIMSRLVTKYGWTEA